MKTCILSATESHDCHQFAALLLRGFQTHSLDQIPPTLPEDLVTEIGDSLQHNSTCFADYKIYIHTSTGYNDYYCI